MRGVISCWFSKISLRHKDSKKNSTRVQVLQVLPTPQKSRGVAQCLDCLCAVCTPSERLSVYLFVLQVLQVAQHRARELARTGTNTGPAPSSPRRRPIRTWSTWSAVISLTSRAGELRSAPAGRMIGIGLRARTKIALALGGARSQGKGRKVNTGLREGSVYRVSP